MIKRSQHYTFILRLLALFALVPCLAAFAADVSPFAARIEARRASGEIGVCAAGVVDGPTVCVGCSEKSIFEMASVSKTFTALVAARLAAQGKLDVDAPITKYLPDHVLAKKGTTITVRDLAAHTSGFTADWMGKAKVYGSEKFPFASDEDYFRHLLTVEPVNPRGVTYRYDCSNFILLGLIVERVTGTDLGTAAKKYVFEPLSMNDTQWRRPVDLSRTVTTYTHGPRPLGTPGDENARGVKRPIGNAGLFTTLEDMLKYADDLLNRRAFEPACYDLLFTPVYDNGRKRRSFGWDMSAGTNPPGWSPAAINHSGYTGTYVAIDPANRRAAVVLTNLKFDDSRRAAAYEFRRALSRDLCEGGAK